MKNHRDIIDTEIVGNIMVLQYDATQEWDGIIFGDSDWDHNVLGNDVDDIFHIIDDGILKNAIKDCLISSFE